MVGKKRVDAIDRMLRRGESASSVARLYRISPTTACKMKREAAKAPRRPVATSAPRSTPHRASAPTRTRPEGSQAAASTDPAGLLATDIELRLALRHGLAADFRVSVEPRERAQLAAALTTTLDGIRKVLLATGPDQDEHDDEADAFDHYMLKIVAKARVVVGAGGVFAPFRGDSAAHVPTEARCPPEDHEQAGGGS